MGERLRGRPGSRQRSRRMARTLWLCEMCQAKGRTTQADVVDHKIALAHGGMDTDENTQNLCHPCHDIKTREEFGLRKPRQRFSVEGWPI